MYVYIVEWVYIPGEGEGERVVMHVASSWAKVEEFVQSDVLADERDPNSRTPGWYWVVTEEELDNQDLETSTGEVQIYNQEGYRGTNGCR